MIKVPSTRTNQDYHDHKDHQIMAQVKDEGSRNPYPELPEGLSEGK